MSTVGQAAGGLIGGIVGFINPVLGWQVGTQIGIMLGGLLDPPKGPTVSGPRLGDLTIQTSTYGSVIPRVYGTVAIHGNIFWLENNAITETVKKKKSGGKGGSPSTTTKTYLNSATFAVGLCKGPIVGVKRIWIKGELYYDAGSTDASTIAASNASATGFAVYLGTDTQLPDARMQATLGAGNTPAYRGLAYIVFYDLPLAKYGETLAGAQVKAEVVASGTDSVYGIDYSSYTGDGAGVYGIASNGTLLCSTYKVVSGASKSSISANGGSTWTSYDSTTLPTAWSAGYGIASDGRQFCQITGGTDRIYRSYDGVTWIEQLTATVDGFQTIGWGNGIWIVGCVWDSILRSTDAITWTSVALPRTILACGDVMWSSVYRKFYLAYGAVSGNYIATSDDGVVWSETSLGTYSDSWFRLCEKGGTIIARRSGAANECYITTDGSTWTLVTSVAATNNVVTDGVVFFGTYSATYYYSYDGITWTSVDITPSMTGGAGYAVWTGAHFVWLEYGGGATQEVGMVYQRRIVTTDTNLDAIVYDECMQSGILQPADVDTSALTSAVCGYSVASTGSIRSALSQPQAVWPFDVVQKGYTIAFIPRGGASVATIDQDDLDARNSGAGPGVQVTVSREMDTQLPRRMIIRHLDYDREFDIGEQYAERLNTDAVNEETQDLAIVMTAAEAAGTAEVLLYLRWLERHDIAFTIPSTYTPLEPSDVVTLETPEGNVLVRLTAMNYRSDGTLECVGKYASQAVYTPVALGVSSAVTGSTTIPSSGPTSYVLLDVPYLHTAQADPSFLAAMYGGLGWPGGVLIRTDDAGTTWSELQAFDAPGGDVAIATNFLSSADSRVWDATAYLHVTMLSGSLSSVTALAVLNGQNAFAYGDHGRWEIIGVQDCTLVTAGQYVLTNLLRGRAGTEWAMSLHQAGDKVVTLSLTDVTAIGMSAATIGVTREYRGITFSQDVDTDVDYPFAYTGVNLECLSPVHFHGYRSPSTSDWTLQCVRRSRTDGEWRDFVDAGLSETTEAYEIDIFADDTYAAVKRTITSTTSTCTYTSAQQITDFGGVQSDIFGKWYQMSSVVGRGYPLIFSATSGPGDPTRFAFTQTDNIDYFELGPSALNLLDETFPSDTGFVKYTEGTPGSTSVSSNQYVISHTGAQNDIVVKDATTTTMPQFWAQVSIDVTDTSATSYDNGGVGLVEDDSNFIFASMDRLANVIRLQIKIGGASSFVGSVAATWGTAFKLGLSLVGNSACVWKDIGSGWVCVVKADVTATYDFRTSGNLSGWRPGFTLASGGGTSTWKFSEFQFGRFGGVGMRDQTLVTHDDGTTYYPSVDVVMFTATCPDPAGVAYCGVFSLDLNTRAISQTAAIMVERGGKVYNDLAAHIIYYAGGNRRVLMSSWGNGFGGAIQVWHALLTSGDVLTGSSVLSTLSQITLPGQTGVAPGAYDPMAIWDATNSRWLIAYTLVDDTSFSGNPFYPAICSSTDFSSFSLIAKDSAHAGYEGTKIVTDGAGQWHITAGGPAGSGNSSRVYDMSLNYLGVLDCAFAGGSDTQPHPMMFAYGSGHTLISFDNTRYDSGSFTWGNLRIYESPT